MEILEKSSIQLPQNRCKLILTYTGAYIQRVQEMSVQISNTGYVYSFKERSVYTFGNKIMVALHIHVLEVKNKRFFI